MSISQIQSEITKALGNDLDTEDAEHCAEQIIQIVQSNESIDLDQLTSEFTDFLRNVFGLDDQSAIDQLNETLGSVHQDQLVSHQELFCPNTSTKPKAKLSLKSKIQPKSHSTEEHQSNKDSSSDDEKSPTNGNKKEPYRNAFQFYSTQMKKIVNEELKTKYPDERSRPDARKEISFRWNALSKEEKAEWQEKTDADNAKRGAVQTRSTKSPKKESSEKKPMTTVNFYVHEMNENHKDQVRKWILAKHKDDIQKDYLKHHPEQKASDIDWDTIKIPGKFNLPTINNHFNQNIKGTAEEAEWIKKAKAWNEAEGRHYANTGGASGTSKTYTPNPAKSTNAFLLFRSDYLKDHPGGADETGRERIARAEKAWKAFKADSDNDDELKDYQEKANSHNKMVAEAKKATAS